MSTSFPGGGGVVGFPVQIRASQPTLVITVRSGPNCATIGRLRKPQKDYSWRLDVPTGSQSKLDNTKGTLLVSFTPDKAGPYTVVLDACGIGCKIDGRPVDIDDPGKERTTSIDVASQRQALPDFVPPAHPSPQGEGPSMPLEYTEAIGFCGSKALLAIGLRPEWFTTDITESAARRLANWPKDESTSPRSPGSIVLEGTSTMTWTCCSMSIRGFTS